MYREYKFIKNNKFDNIFKLIEINEEVILLNNYHFKHVQNFECF